MSYHVTLFCIILLSIASYYIVVYYNTYISINNVIALYIYIYS